MPPDLFSLIISSDKCKLNCFPEVFKESHVNYNATSAFCLYQGWYITRVSKILKKLIVHLIYSIDVLYRIHCER